MEAVWDQLFTRKVLENKELAEKIAFFGNFS